MFVLLLGCSVFLSFAQPVSLQPHDTISGNLPDVLLSKSGKKITTAKQWNEQRRPEILALFKNEMFGQLPGKPATISFQLLESSDDVLNGLAIRKQVRVFFTKEKDGHWMDILLYYPIGAKHAVPVFVGYNFAGNQSITNDNKVALSKSWMSPKTKGVVNNRATDSTRGIAASGWPIETILKRGYAIATIYAGDLDPDFDDGFKNGVQALYPELQNREDNFASLSAWAWGLSRAMDYFETNAVIDNKKVIVIGTSRMGKAALWAGANDTRFAMVISNESGAGGAKLFHHVGGEDTKNLCKRFPYWFCNAFKKYCGQDTSLPFDQHMLLALIAPRPLYVASAIGSEITDSYGEFLSAKYASPVYRLFKKSGLLIKGFPPVNTPSFGTIGYHVRTGKHDILLYDWEQFLTFADKHFYDKQK